jgi:hypothetical protein
VPAQRSLYISEPSFRVCRRLSPTAGRSRCSRVAGEARRARGSRSAVGARPAGAHGVSNPFECVGNKFLVVLPRIKSLQIMTQPQKKNLSVVGMGWGLAFVLILIQAWERCLIVFAVCRFEAQSSCHQRTGPSSRCSWCCLSFCFGSGKPCSRC